MVLVISSSVILSNDEVASSKIRRCGCLSSARAIDSLCFSPPLSFKPPSPIILSKPCCALDKIEWQLAFSSATIISESVAFGNTKLKFSLMVPANNCVSCVTKPI